MDWTGSGKQRREQGICLPPAAMPNRTPRLSIAAGTSVLICQVTDSNQRWRRYRTKQPLGFRRYEHCRHGQYTFRHLGWFIRVPIARVQKIGSTVTRR
jgi:hypothetical protein